MTEPQDETTPRQPDDQHGQVSIWKAGSGKRLWSIKVRVGETQEQLDHTLAIALEIEKRIG